MSSVKLAFSEMSPKGDEDWTFEGFWTESMRQLGNSVPVTMYEAIANELASLLTAKKVVHPGRS